MRAPPRRDSLTCFGARYSVSRRSVSQFCFKSLLARRDLVVVVGWAKRQRAHAFCFGLAKDAWVRFALPTLQASRCPGSMSEMRHAGVVGTGFRQAAGEG